jgi:hypothetical protein
MYGLVNKAIKDLVVNNHGVEKWNEICKLSDFPEGDFVGMNSYPDKLTYDLVKNASRVLKLMLIRFLKLLENIGSCIQQMKVTEI